MPLRIAFDMDGVFANMETVLLRHAETLFGEAALRAVRERVAADRQKTEAAEGAGESESPSTGASMPALTTLHLSPRQQNKLWQHVQAIDNFWETLEEIEPGIIARLAALSVERRWEVIFLTKRPSTAGDTAQIQSQRWLQAKGFPIPSVFVVQGSRGRVAAALALDVVVDDRPENCLDVVVDSKARAILVWRDDQKNLPAAARRLGIGVVKSVGECLDILSQVGPEEPEEGIMSRVMKALGLKQASPSPSQEATGA